MAKNRKKEEDNSGIFVPAGIFIGVGVGFLINELAAGIFIGLGAGFVGMAIARNWGKK